MTAEIARLERLLEIYKGLVEVSALINGITDSSALLSAILEVARRVMRVEAASLFLAQLDGSLELVSTSGGSIAVADGSIAKIIIPRGRGISGWVMEHRKPLLIPDAYADDRFYREVDKQTGFRTRAVLCAPLLSGDSDIGALQILNPIGRDTFDEADLEAFTAYGTLAATAIDKLRTTERQRSQERLAQEFAFAHEIQASFLPQTLPHIACAEFSAVYQPARNVGGDFYDVIELGPDEIYFVIGDVSGKGMPAALLMAQALSILRLVLRPGISPVAAMARWNSMLTGHTIRGMFITALIGRVVCSTRHVEICSAGHCHPFLTGVKSGARQIPVTGSPPLGLLPELPGRSHTLTLERDEWLVLFTDGLVESFNEADELLDPAGVARLLSREFSHASDLTDALLLGEAQHRRSAPRHDDLTILAFGFK